MVEFVKIKDPDKPGDYLRIAKADFDPAKHQLFEEAEASDETAAASKDEPPHSGRHRRR